jgi:mannosyl-3-phosphoglycerate phosphatase
LTSRTTRLRPKTRVRAAPHRAAVFTAIDGTLLDVKTFEGGAARVAVTRLHALGIPVIPVSVMTLDEIAPIADDFGFRDAMVIEAGGAIARWSGSWEVEPCGPPAETLLDVVRDIEDRSGARLVIFSALERRDAEVVSGRHGEMLEASIRRCFSEPFMIESGDEKAIRRAAAELGFSVRSGRRFLHLCRECDEGEAFARVRNEIQCETAIGLGGSVVDAEWLSRVDIPVIVPGADGADPQLLARVPKARIAPAPAPAGWAAAIDEICDTLLATKLEQSGRQ